MTNKNKNKLVELVQDALFQHAHYVAKERRRALEAETEAEHSEIYDSIKTLHEYVADHLIENGVVVPPCEVYKDVYLIVNGIIERCGVEGIYYTRKKNYVRLRPYHQEYLGNWSKYYTPSLRHFGKTVFLTQEEAEQKLNEMRGSNG